MRRVRFGSAVRFCVGGEPGAADGAQPFRRPAERDPPVDLPLHRGGRQGAADSRPLAGPSFLCRGRRPRRPDSSPSQRPTQRAAEGGRPYGGARADAGRTANGRPYGGRDEHRSSGPSMICGRGRRIAAPWLDHRSCVGADAPGGPILLLRRDLHNGRPRAAAPTAGQGQMRGGRPMAVPTGCLNLTQIRRDEHRSSGPSMICGRGRMIAAPTAGPSFLCRGRRPRRPDSSPSQRPTQGAAEGGRPYGWTEVSV